MTDPERWLHSEDAPSGMGEMLSAAQKAGPTAAQKVALATKLGVAGSGVWLLPLWKSLAVGGSVLGVAWAVSTMSSKDSERIETSSQLAAEAPIEGGETKSIDGERAAESGTASNADADGATGVKIDHVTGADKARIAANSTSADSGSGQRSKNAPTEAALIKGARAALEASPQQALGLLTQHASLYPKGVLAEEREVLRIRALKNIGRRSEAETEEQKFRKAHPESVHHLP